MDPRIHHVSILPPIESRVVGIDTETTYRKGDSGSDPYTQRLLSIQVSDGNTSWVLTDPKGFPSVVPLLVNPEIKKVGHGLSFDWKWLKHCLGVEMVNIFDTLMAERLLWVGDDSYKNGLDDVMARRYGVYLDKTIRDQFADHIGPMTEEQIEYAGKDVLWLPKLREDQLNDISLRGLGKVLSLENKVVPITSQMELDGVPFDRDLWDSHRAWLETRLEELSLQIAKRLGIPYIPALFGSAELGINIGSRDQMLPYLQSFGYPYDATKALLLKMAAEEAEEGSPLHGLITDYLEWKSWEKLRTYGYPRYINPVTGNIHCRWNQEGTDTGRYSSSDPNMQQVPAPVLNKPNFRWLFPPPPGEVCVVADFSKEEPNILAEVSGDENLRSACASGDLYCETGKMVYGREIEKHSDERKIMKVVVLASMYGSQAKGLAVRTGKSVEEMESLLKSLRTVFSKGFAWGDAQEQMAVQRGYVTSAYGRRRNFSPEFIRMVKGRIGNIARNTPVQSTGGDIGKLAMVKYDEWRKEHCPGSRINKVIHDELVVHCKKDDAEMVLYNVIAAMEGAMGEICPHVVPKAEGAIMDKWGKV